MIRKIDKVRAGRATGFGDRWKSAIRELDKRWFQFLGVVHGWTVRRAEAHCRREKHRRFRRLMESNRAFLN